MGPHGVQPVNRSLHLFIIALGTVWALGCEDPFVRDDLNAFVNSLDLAHGATVTVQGGSIISKGLSGNPDDAEMVTVRAQGLDVRLDLVTNACVPSLVHIALTHMSNANLETTYRIFLDSVPEPTEALLGALAVGLTPQSDVHEDAALALTNEQAFEIRQADTSSEIQMTVCMKRQGLHAKVLPGWVSMDECGPLFEAPNAPCAEIDSDITGRLPSTPMRVRLRTRNAVAGSFTFAVWGNIAGQMDTLDRVISAVNEAEPNFSVVSGDFTKFGRGEKFEAITEHLDANLESPWFGTLGDRDVFGSAEFMYPNFLGASNFAFDVGMLRIIVLDTANRSLGLTAQSLLANWLSDSPLGWPGALIPGGRIVVTHVAPFDPFGSRGLGFRDRNEGATVMAQLLHSGVSHLFTSHLSTYRNETLDGLQIIHSGGAGAPIEAESSEGHHWLLVRVDPTCESPSTPTQCATHFSGDCPCIEVVVQSLP